MILIVPQIVQMVILCIIVPTKIGVNKIIDNQPQPLLPDTLAIWKFDDSASQHVLH